MESLFAPERFAARNDQNMLCGIENCTMRYKLAALRNEFAHCHHLPRRWLMRPFARLRLEGLSTPAVSETNSPDSVSDLRSRGRECSEATFDQVGNDHVSTFSAVDAAFPRGKSDDGEHGQSSRPKFGDLCR